MIRLALESDTQAVLDLAKKVYSDFMLLHGVEMIDKDLRKTVTSFINLKQVLVVERDSKVVGMTAWVLVPHPANASCKIFQEILYCSVSDHKIDALALLRAIETKSKEVGATVTVLANLSLENEPQLRRIYEKRGYQYMESNYCKAN